MAALQVEGQFIKQRGLKTNRAQRVDSHPSGYLVHLAEIQTESIAAQQIGVLLELLRCIRTVDLVNAGSAPKGQLMGGEKFQQSPHGVVLQKILLNFLGPTQTHAPDFGEFFRGIGQHVEGILPKALHNGLSGFGADPLHRSGGQVIIDTGGGGGQHSLISRHIELRAIFRVSHINAIGGDGFPRAQIRHRASDH